MLDGKGGYFRVTRMVAVRLVVEEGLLPPVRV